MKAMVLTEICSLEENQTPLKLIELSDPVPAGEEILVEVSACGVCHTELDEIEGRTPPSILPVVPGHQVVGRVRATGPDATIFKIGDRVGIAWIYSACGKCVLCLAGNENLCGNFKATGRDVNGGYAQYMTVAENFAYRIPDCFGDFEAAPLLCAGAIGFRSLRLTGLQNGQNLGLTGFGASGHLVLKLVRHRYPEAKVSVFARSEEERAFSRELGAVWAGDFMEESPEKMDCIIDTTPAWKPMVESLKNLRPGGRLVVNAIRKEKADIEYLLRLDYPAHLWMEKEIKSVANVSRSDVSGFLGLAAEMNIRPEVQEFALEEANKALVEIKMKRIKGAKVLRID
jgi:alcohol dehydrogenase, propanol-preferring